MSARRDADDGRDAHLRAALQHAPDRDAMAPAALSEQILAVARRSVLPARAPASWAGRVRAALASALDALTRPAGAAAFASLVLATVIGVMWREGAPPEALPERAPPPGVAPTAPPAVAPAVPAPAAPAPAAAGDDAASKRAGEAAGAARPPPHDGRAAKTAADSRRGVTTANSADGSRADRSRAAARDATPPKAGDARPETSVREESRKGTAALAAAQAPPARQASAASQEAAAPPPTAPRTASAQAPPPAAAPLQAPAAAPVPASPPAAATMRAPAPPAPSATPALPRAAPLAPAPAATARATLAPAAAEPLADVLLALGREASGTPPATTHRWQRGNAPALPHGALAQAWLVELQRVTQGAWHTAPGTPPAGAQALVLRDGRGMVARVELIEDGVLWHSASMPNMSWRAALPQATLERLRESLAAWAGR